MNSSNVIRLRTGKPIPDTLEISETSMTVGDELYRVRRAVDRDTKRGFVTIIDDAGTAIIVLSSSFPHAHIHQLIVGWRTGYGIGLDRGRRELRMESVS